MDSLYLELISSRHDICRDEVSCMMGFIYNSNCRWIETMARIKVHGFVGGLKQCIELKENCTIYSMDGKE